MTETRKISLQQNVHRRLEQAIEYVSRTWFPANPDILERIHNRSRTGKYMDNFDLLIHDIKSDFAIYSFLLKQLREHYPKDGGAIDPTALMRSMERHDLVRLISIPADAISSHSFKEMEKAQASRLKHFIWGCSTSEILAEKSAGEFNADQVFSYSVVRQLGLNLIAWNYPSVYGRVLQSMRDGAEGDFDQLLYEQLGFAPIELAAALTLPDEIDLQVAEILGLPQHSKNKLLVTDETSMQRKLCEIGDAFAILNDPDNYPTGTPAARTSIEEIEDILGPGGAEQISKAVKNRYVSYVAANPELLSLDSAKVSVKHGNNAYGKALFQRNHYAARLSDDFKVKLALVYSKVMKGQVSTEAIQALVSDLIPISGFYRGCIFLLEQKEFSLIPRLRIGEDNLSRYRTIVRLDPGLDDNPIVEAFYSSFPIKQSGAMYLGETVNFVAGVLGTSERAGVLYLEMTNALSENSKVDPVIVFRALRQCMNDCLNLK